MHSIDNKLGAGELHDRMDVVGQRDGGMQEVFSVLYSSQRALAAWVNQAIVCKFVCICLHMYMHMHIQKIKKMYLIY